MDGQDEQDDFYDHLTRMKINFGCPLQSCASYLSILMPSENQTEQTVVQMVVSSCYVPGAFVAAAFVAGERGPKRGGDG